VYVPADFSERSALALDSYHPIPWDEYALMRQIAVIFNGDTGLVKNYPDGPTLPLITGQWVELRMESDLEAD